MKDKKDAFFQIRVSTQELKDIKQAAALLGFDTSDYARMIIMPSTTAIISGDEERYYRVIQNTTSYLLSKKKEEEKEDEPF